MEALQRLVGKNHVVLVEGRTDADILSVRLQTLRAAEKTRFHAEQVLFMQCGGVDNLAFNANRQCTTAAQLKRAVVADSDRFAHERPRSLPSSRPHGLRDLLG